MTQTADENSLVSTLSRRNEELRLLVDIGKALASSLDLEEILNTVLNEAGKLLKADIWSLLLREAGSDDLIFKIAVNPGTPPPQGERLSKGEGVAGWVVAHGEPLLISDIAQEPRFCERIDRDFKYRTTSIICAPIKSRDQIFGVIEMINTLDKESFSDNDLTIITTVADYVAIAIENARLFEKINELVITDELTGLFNARQLHRILKHEIERSERYGDELSLIFFDLDHFKDVNDTYGHLVGSRMLSEIGQLLKDNLRLSDHPIRYGGDEFIVVLPSTGKHDAFIVATKLCEKLRNFEFLVENTVLTMTGSFGVAAFPDDVNSTEEMIKLADSLMYEVKTAGRNNVKMLQGGILGTPQ
ncbi:MAG: sensor domain-containing diguanylate cyclase [Desulfuromonadaceae bacterium]|nr:sensor domain-containing diguanylate cyclase [Desulfuromonadaceae bacterium]